MSPDEVKSFCEAAKPYQLRIQVRMKQDLKPLIGKIEAVEREHFQLISDGEVLNRLRYAWVARIQNA